MSVPPAFRFGHARGGWQDCVAACAEAIGRPGQGLGFVYFTEALAPHAAEIVGGLAERTGVAQWVGTAGSGVLATGVEYADEPALVAMVAGFEPGSFRVFSGRAPLPLVDERTDSGAIASGFAIAHADLSTPDLPDLVGDVSSRLASGYLVGGVSSARSVALQIAGDVLSGGLSGAVLASDVMLRTRLTQGCAPLGPHFTITAGSGNVIETLDGLPALEVLKQVAGKALPGVTDPRRIAMAIHVGLPIPASDTGDYLVRNLIGIDPDNGLVAIGDEVRVGDPILFCLRDEASARKDLQRILAEIREGEPPRGALYYSCIARGEHLFGRRGAEMELVREALGDIPLVGLFCNGEISHDRLYAYTGVLTVFE